MFEKIIKTFVKNSNDITNVKVRESYGKLTGIVGIILNVILSIAKVLSGVLTGAISIISDGINNLSDAASSIITLIGFKLSAKKPDKNHPFGYGRIEYFAGLIVSLLILVVAFELFMDSIDKIKTGATPDTKSTTLLIVVGAILVLSILVKLWMALFNRYVGKKINSVAMQATSLDSISDCISTVVVLISMILAIFIKNVPIDGIAGIVVSLFIAFTGLRSVKEIVELLLGTAPDKEFIEEVANFVLDFDKNVVGIHDVMMHDYGPGRKILVMHVEVPAEQSIMDMHDMVDNIETQLENKFNLFATIHMDPVYTKNVRVAELKQVCCDIVKQIDKDFDMHDFRMNEGATHANLIFDVVITHETKFTEDEIKALIDNKIKEYDKKLNTVIKIEYSFV